MTCYQPGRSKTLSERGCIGFTFSPSNCFYWGAAAPQTPCCSWGASSPPDPLAGGLQPPVPPCIPRGSASRALRFFLVPRSWKPLTCGYVAAGAFFSEKWPPYFWKPLTCGYVAAGAFFFRKWAPYFWKPLTWGGLKQNSFLWGL